MKKKSSLWSNHLICKLSIGQFKRTPRRAGILNSFSFLFPEYHSLYIRWLLISLCAHMEHSYISICSRPLVTSKESSDFFLLRKTPILHNSCATCYELPLYISTIQNIEYYQYWKWRRSSRFSQGAKYNFTKKYQYFLIRFTICPRISYPLVTKKNRSYFIVLWKFTIEQS